jgi:16S rRNA G966 N2-methylase RsmD
VFYDFNKPEDIPEEYENSFDFIVIDPPFVTDEVWNLYVTAAKFLLSEDGKLLLSTIDEKEEFLKEKLGVNRIKFRPSIPNLVYQYSFYANYEDEDLDQANPEIPEF